MLLVTPVPLTVAVMVAVRLIPDVPPEKVTATWPLLAVMPEAELNNPVELEKSTVSEGSTALLAVRTVAVRVTELEPSLLTLVAVEVSCSVAAAEEVGVVGVPVGTALPPQPARRTTKDEARATSKLLG
jgi:hypothetical protein